MNRENGNFSFERSRLNFSRDGSLLKFGERKKKKEQLLDSLAGTRSIMIQQVGRVWIEIYAKRAYVLTNLIMKLQGVPRSFAYSRTIVHSRRPSRRIPSSPVHPNTVVN